MFVDPDRLAVVVHLLVEQCQVRVQELVGDLVLLVPLQIVRERLREIAALPVEVGECRH